MVNVSVFELCKINEALKAEQHRKREINLFVQFKLRCQSKITLGNFSYFKQYFSVNIKLVVLTFGRKLVSRSIFELHLSSL